MKRHSNRIVFDKSLPPPPQEVKRYDSPSKKKSIIRRISPGTGISRPRCNPLKKPAYFKTPRLYSRFPLKTTLVLEKERVHTRNRLDAYIKNNTLDRLIFSPLPYFSVRPPFKSVIPTCLRKKKKKTTKTTYLPTKKRILFKK